MKVLYEKTVGATIQFSPSELKIAVIVLKAMYEWCGAEFLHTAYKDIEKDLIPQLPHINYFHVCIKCFRDLDERNPDTLRIQNNDVIRWQCRSCKPLKPDSYRER